MTIEYWILETECGAWTMAFVCRPSVIMFDVGLFLTLKSLPLLIVIFEKKAK